MTRYGKSCTISGGYPTVSTIIESGVHASVLLGPDDNGGLGRT